MLPILSLLLLLFEILLMLKAAEAWGAGHVFLWLIGCALLGAWWIRRQGLRALHQLQQARIRGELPALPMIEGLLGLLAGVLLMVPGFISDALAVLLMIGAGRRRSARWVQHGMQRAHPELRGTASPITIDGEYRRR